MVPLAPLIAARRPAVAFTGVLSGLALRDLLAVPGDVLGAEARWEILQGLGELGTQPLVLLAGSHYQSSSSVRCARCRPFTQKRSCPHRSVRAASSPEPPVEGGVGVPSSRSLSPTKMLGHRRHQGTRAVGSNVEIGQWPMFE